MAKVVCVLYDDPVDGSKTYLRDGFRTSTATPTGNRSHRRLDFTPGSPLGSVSGELGLQRYLKASATSWS
jgi:formate dehydrogenase